MGVIRSGDTQTAPSVAMSEIVNSLLPMTELMASAWIPPDCDVGSLLLSEVWINLDLNSFPKWRDHVNIKNVLTFSSLLGNSQHWSQAMCCLGQEDPYKALKWGSKFCLETDFYRKGSDLQNEKKKNMWQFWRKVKINADLPSPYK